MAGNQCCENPPALDAASGSGAVVEDLGGLRSYVAGTAGSGPAILLLSDIYGFEAPKLRKLADKIAAAGLYTVAPDFFGGDPFISENTERPWEVWLKSHSTEKGYENARDVVTALKQKGVSSVGVAGFCWGGRVALELAKSGDIETSVLLHPSFISVDDMKGVKVPLAILAAENDWLAPLPLIKQFEEVLSANSQVASFVKIFPGTTHGWTVRYDDDDELAVKKAEEAHKDLLDWLNRFLKP